MNRLPIRLRALAADHRGAGAMEFALAGPVLILFIMAIFQLGLMFYANSGMKHAVGEGARRAIIFPRPTDAEILAELDASEFGLDPARVSKKTVTHGTTGTGTPYADIELQYQLPMDFGLFDLKPLTLIERRRAYLQ